MISRWMKLPPDRLAAFSPDFLETYLLSHGWVIDPAASSDDRGFYLYPSEPDAEAIVPRWRSFADYSARIADVLLMIAAVEQRYVWEIFLEFENALKAQIIGRDGDSKVRNGTSNGASSQSPNQAPSAVPKE